MSEQVKPQPIPVNMYSANGRLMVSTPMPGLEAENITIEVTDQGQLRLQGELRGQLKEHDGKERFLDEWAIGGMHAKWISPFRSMPSAPMLRTAMGCWSWHFHAANTPLPHA